MGTILAFAVAACADQAELVAPEAMNTDLQTTSDGVWFVTEPPEPALVEDTYDVEVNSVDDGLLLTLESETTWVCKVTNQISDGLVLYATVYFSAAGDCALKATSGSGIAYQIFPVYEPSDTPAPIMKTCTRTINSSTLSLEIPIDQDCPTGWD